MWYYDLEDPTKRKLFLPTIQKSVIHTAVDVLNGILEMAEKNNNRLYEIITTKYFKKLKLFFNNNELYTKLENNYKSSISGNESAILTKGHDYRKLSGKYVEQDLPFINYESFKHQIGRAHV